ncbi:hypothetical protein GCM10022225_80210 [Plantactinospora mayteni]|uniref:Twin-arginine translocation signal domain-containing protein n=1 Tax=Plantactinospora mayteni TaxID=566021 RepID=A0ABQ4F399_9ACTN|nr:hypothetical protein Pma05_79420 [Plantactinospora mayteni]
MDEEGLTDRRPGPTRRNLLAGAGGLVAGVAAATPAAAGGDSPRRGRSDAPLPPLRFFTDTEAATVSAMAERIFRRWHHLSSLHWP